MQNKVDCLLEFLLLPSSDTCDFIIQCFNHSSLLSLQVMLTKNINVHRNLVNGARGVVKGFETTKGIGE